MSLTETVFGTPYIQKASESGDATDVRGDAQLEDVQMDEGSASDKDGDCYRAAEPEVELAVFKTIPQSPMTNGTRSKSWKVLIADALMSSDSEDE
jgi:hypothetical protein